MRAIHKYTLEVGDTTLKIKAGAKVLALQVQRRQVVLWALVDPDRLDHEIWVVRCYGTGQPLLPDELDGLEFLGTAQLANGDFVGHFFVMSRYAETLPR